MEEHMGLIQALGLTRPAVKGQAANRPSAGSKGKPPSIKGDVQVEQAAVVRKVSLGEVRWQRRKVILLGYTDADGDLVETPPSKGWKMMAASNLWGLRSLAAIKDANTLDGTWRAALPEVQAGVTRGKALVERVGKAADAISERKRIDTKFREAVNQYFRQVDGLRPLQNTITQADSHYREMLDGLQSTILGTQIEAENDEIGDLKDEEANVEKDRARAKEIFSQVLSLGGALAGVAPVSAVSATALITSAASLAGNVLIDGSYDLKIDILETKLKQAKEKLKDLKSKKFKADIEAAQERVIQAVSACHIAVDNFVSALKEAARSRAAAADASGAKKGDATAIVAEAIALRTRQQAAIDTFDAAAAQYLKLSEGMEVGLRKLRDMQAWVGDWIKEVSVQDARLKLGSPWANQTELVGATNAVQLGDVILSGQQARDDCRKAKASMSDEAESAAMAPYLEALQIIETAMTRPAPSTLPKVGNR
jgi:hypothetical protein